MSTSEPSWELYGTFLSVLETGSLSAASRALKVAQPTVRRRLEALEASLGAVLFTRSPNGLTPTEAALATRPHAEAMAASARAMVRALSGPLEADHGTVRVTTSEVIGAEVLPPLLAPWLPAHPNLQLEWVLSNRTQDLLRREADVAVRMVAPTQAALVARKVGVIPVGLFAHRDYLRRHPAPRRASDLSGHRLIGADRSSAQLEALKAIGAAETSRDFAWRSDNDLVQLAALRAGLGIGVCQVPLAARTPVLVRVLPAVAFPLETWVVMHEDLRRVQRVRLVFEQLVQVLQRYLTAPGGSTNGRYRP